MTVVRTVSEGPYARLAERIADEESTNIVGEFSRVDPADRVLVVGSPDSLDADSLARLQRAVTGEHHGNVGIITGRTVEAAEDLYFRDPTDDDRDGDFILLRGVQDAPTVDEDVAAAVGDDVTADRLEREFDGGLRSWSTLFNGKRIHGYLSDGYVCGFPTERPRPFTDDPPPCVVDGERDCPRDGTLVFADDLDASHVFVSACDPILPGDSPVNLGLGLLDGAAALIASYRVLHVLPEQLALHHAALRAGLPAGERVYLLNRMSVSSNTEAYPYLLFGRPDAAASDVEPGSWDLSYAIEEGKATLEFESVDAALIDVTIPASGLPEGDLHLRSRSAGDDLLYAAFREGDSIRILIYGWRRIERDRLELVLTGADDHPHEWVLDAFDRARKLDALTLLPDKANGQVDNARNRLRGANRYRSKAQIEVGAHAEVAKRFEGARSDLENARDSIVQDLANRNPVMPEMLYGDQVYCVDVDVLDDGCPYCGGDVYRLHQAEPVSEAKRSLGECSYCAYTFDVPYGSALLPVMRGDLTSIAGTTDVEVAVPNPFDRTIGVAVCPKVPFADEPAFRPETRTIEVDPGATGSAAFEFDVTQFVPWQRDGQYLVNAYVVTDDLRVAVAIRTATLRPDR